MSSYSKQKNSKRQNGGLSGAQLGTALILAAAAIGLSITLYFNFNKPPIVAVADLKYVQLLRTAISNRSVSGVQKLRKVIDKKKDVGELSESQWGHFDFIMEFAIKGQWDKADEACDRFESAQQFRSR